MNCHRRRLPETDRRAARNSNPKRAFPEKGRGPLTGLAVTARKSPICTDTKYVIEKVVARLEADSRWALARSVRALVAERDALKEISKLGNAVLPMFPQD